MRVRWALILLASTVAVSQDRTIPPARLSITATPLKKAFKAGEPIRVRLQVQNPLHDKVRIPRILIDLPLVVCNDYEKTDKPYKPYYEVGFDVGVFQKQSPYRGCTPSEDHSLLFARGSLVDRSVLLFSGEFFGVEYVIPAQSQAGTYTIGGVYHAWDVSTLKADDFAGLKNEDSYIPIGDFDLPAVTITVER